jgi:hypothetical protein
MNSLRTAMSRLMSARNGLLCPATMTMKVSRSVADAASSSQNDVKTSQVNPSQLSQSTTQTSQEIQKSQKSQESSLQTNVINPLKHPDFFGVNDMVKMEELFQ